MSSRTPTECVERATDSSADQDDREDAIRELKTANECDELARLVRMEDLEEQYRQQALAFMNTAQCEALLEDLAEADALEQPLRREAQELLSDLRS